MDERSGRHVVVKVSVGQTAREDHPVVVDLSKVCTEAGLELSRDESVRVTELTGEGGQVPCQVDWIDDGASLVFLLGGTTQADGERRFRIELGQPSAMPGKAAIRVEDEIMHQGQSSYRVTTPGGTYVYHKAGGGFASLFDTDGNDWISFKPKGGSAGHYRGIPNLCHPQGYFHPGNEKCRSKLLADGPLRAVIRSESLDGKWVCRWDIYPGFAKLTVLKADGPYWFLYEGTPGGKLDETSDEVMLSDGSRRSAGKSWAESIKPPKWIAFVDGPTERSLWLACHGKHETLDSYWPMEHNMTVFGFGRKDLNKYLKAVPYHFTIALADAHSHKELASIVAAATTPLNISTQNNQE